MAARESLRVFRRDDDSADTVLDGFGVASDVGGDDGERCGHGFDNGIRKAFAARGQDEDVGGGEVGAEVGDSAGEVEMGFKVEVMDESLKLGEVAGVEDIAGDAEGGVGKPGGEAALRRG